MKLARARDVAAIDRLAAEQYGLPTRVLMENAGAAVAEAAGLLLGGVRDRRVLVVCGKGNNGGDGLVAARLLLRAGSRARALVAGSFQEMGPDARAALAAASRAGVEVQAVTGEEAVEALRAAEARPDLVIDALFGTGFSPPARGLGAALISFVNGLGAPVLAVDIPSGLCADHGRVEGEAVAAAATVALGLAKPGLLLHPAARLVGRLWLGDIGLPPGITDRLDLPAGLITPADLAAGLAPRDPESHKGTHGHVLVVAGSWGFAGAAVLAARGALRAGAGLVTAALPESQAPPTLDGLPEAMLLPLPESGRGAVGERALGVVLDALAGKDALAVGPGLSRAADAASLVRDLIPRVGVPTVIDADGINALEGRPAVLLESRAELVITPHPGELGRLLGVAAGELRERRPEAALDCAKRFGAVVVLKGARTVVAAPNGEVWINATGNPAMATGGMGDVLTGVIAAHLARGMAALPAALLGVHLHGLAGDIAAAERGPWGLLAGEVADLLPRAVRTLQERLGNAGATTGRCTLLVP